ncbi:Uncharacterised protein g174 [Pycnogonum litorale]
MKGQNFPPSRTRLVQFSSAVILLYLASHVTVGLYDVEEDTANRRLEEVINKPKLLPRYKTKIEIRGRTYHYHNRSGDSTSDGRQKTWRPRIVPRRGASGYEERRDTSILTPKSRSHVLAKQCDRCAIVGNTDVLRGRRFGSIIDSADCVFRFGFGPVDGFNVDYGSKSTFRIATRKSLEEEMELTNNDETSTENVIVYDCDSDDDCDVTPDADERSRVNKTQFYYFNKYGRINTVEMFKQQNILRGQSSTLKPSVVWYTLMVIKQVRCKETQAYGLIPPYFCRYHGLKPYKVHYWDANSMKLCNDMKQMENLATEIPSLEEKKLIEHWAWNYRLKFVFPRW